MDILAVLLRTHYFKEDDRIALKVKVLLFLLALLAVVLVFSIFEAESMQAFTLREWILLGLLGTILAGYLVFPKFISLIVLSRLVIAWYLVCIAMGVFGYCGIHFTFFLLALLPVVVFYLFSQSEAKYWNAFIVFYLSMFVIVSNANIIQTALEPRRIVEIIIAYALVSYVFYVLERKREELEAHLKVSNKSNRLIFKEMHHRTKNNLQLIVSLLESQAYRTEDTRIKKTFQAYVDRIKAMSFVHENLYKEDIGTLNPRLVDMHKYLSEVLKNLQDLTPHTIISDIDYITLNIKHSMSIGLIVNEAVSNAIEHAYAAGVGKIDVSFKDRVQTYELEIKDYGIGFDTQKEFDSLGIELIRDLSRSLPGGKVSIVSDEGTIITVTFEKERRE